MQNIVKPPVVLVIAGNDPSGGAGIAADIQAITSLGCHPAPVIAALTVQDTINAYAVEPVAAAFVAAQADKVLAGQPFSHPLASFIIGAEQLIADIGCCLVTALGKHP